MGFEIRGLLRCSLSTAHEGFIYMQRDFPLYGSL